MSDAIEYCDTCETKVGCHMARPQYDWRTRHDSYLKYLYVENPPKLVWNGEEWIHETNTPRIRPTN